MALLFFFCQSKNNISGGKDSNASLGNRMGASRELALDLDILKNCRVKHHKVWFISYLMKNFKGNLFSLPCSHPAAPNHN